MKVCFVGHRKIELTEQLRKALHDTTLMLIDKGATTFLFGSKSEFDNLAWEVVSNLQKQYPYIQRVYVRSTYQHIDKSYEEYLLKFYEITYFPPKLSSVGKNSYIARNYEMIDQCDCCVFYYNDKYVPEQQNCTPLPTIRQSGTKIAYQYAIKKKKIVINLFQ